MITQTARSITDLMVLKVLAQHLDAEVAAGRGTPDSAATALNTADLAAALLRQNPGVSEPGKKGVVRGARIVLRLIDLKRRHLVKHERRSTKIDGEGVVLDLWSITLDGLSVARRGEL